MKKPEPKDFPPESPHDLEWGGYNFEKYSKALEAWERNHPEYQLPTAPGNFSGILPSRDEKKNKKETMIKKYRLKKDLPNVKAGAILEWNSTETWTNGPYKGGRYGIWPMPSEKSCDIIFTPDDVENNPAWFELLPETIEVSLTLKLMGDDELKFPCFCVPTCYYSYNNIDKPIYRWDLAGIVDSKIRGAADYFEIIKTEQVPDR